MWDEGEEYVGGFVRGRYMRVWVWLWGGKSMWGQSMCVGVDGCVGERVCGWVLMWSGD